MDSRYSRQSIVFGKKVQDKIKTIKVGIIGLGALGSNVLNLLIRMGFNNILIIDRDIVELHNLHRTALYTEADIGSPKAHSAYIRALEIDKKVNINYYIADFYENLKLLDTCDIVIECLDSIEGRIVLGNHLKKKGITWIHGAGIKNYGELKLFQKKDCYECFSKGKDSDESCSIDGVNPALTTIVASLQVNELIKYLADTTNKKKTEKYPLIRINLETLQLRTLILSDYCNCKKNIKKIDEKTIISERSCGKGVFRFAVSEDDFKELSKNKNISSALKAQTFYRDNNIVLTADRRAIVSSKTEDIGKKELLKFISEFATK